MRAIGVECQFIAFRTGKASEVIVRRSDIAGLRPISAGACTLILRSGPEIEVQEDANAILQLLTYTPEK